MSKHGFTLIEILVSLLIFAIGGSIALSVLNYTTSQRLKLEREAEAQLLANNIIRTLVLKNKTNPTDPLFIAGTTPMTAWNYGATPEIPADLQGDEVFPYRNFWFGQVPLVEHDGIPNGVDFPASPDLEIGTTTFDPGDPNQSLYEWGFSLTVLNNTNKLIEYNRLEVNGQEWTVAASTTVPIVHEVDNNPAQLLTVVVTWPPAANRTLRAAANRVTITSVIERN